MTSFSTPLFIVNAQLKLLKLIKFFDIIELTIDLKGLKMRIILLNTIFLICFTQLVISGDNYTSTESLAPCSPELDFCKQVLSSSRTKQIVVNTVDAGSGTKRVFVISASADGSLDLINTWNGFDSSIEVSISVQGQGVCASDKSTKTQARNGNDLKVSATCVAVIEGVKTILITRTAGGGMIPTVNANPENTTLRYSWAKLRKVKSIN